MEGMRRERSGVAGRSSCGAVDMAQEAFGVVILVEEGSKRQPDVTLPSESTEVEIWFERVPVGKM